MLLAARSVAEHLPEHSLGAKDYRALNGKVAELEPLLLSDSVHQESNVNHIYHFTFSSSHIKKKKYTERESKKKLVK